VGCFGGWSFKGWEYLLKNTKGGIASERDYSYCIPSFGYCYPCNINTQYCPSPLFYNHTCNGNITFSAFIKGYGNVTTQDEDLIAQYLMEHGPYSIALNAMWLQFYHSGVSDPVLPR
jgi:cathepsin F